MKKFLHSLQPIERVALGGVVLGAIILIAMGFVYPQVGITVLFMFAVLFVFWSILTLIQALTRYIVDTRKKNAEDKL